MAIYISLDDESKGIKKPQAPPQTFKAIKDVYKNAYFAIKEKHKDISNSLERQAQIISDLEKEIDDFPPYYKIEYMTSWYPYIIANRELKLKQMLKKRVDQIKENNPRQKLHEESYVLVRSKSKITDEVRQRKIPSDQMYTLEQEIEHNIKTEPRKYYPDFGYELLNRPENQEILEASNIILLRKSNLKRRKVDFDVDPFGISSFNNLISDSEYVIMARVKKSKRELEKEVLYLLGLRDEHHDNIGTINVVPSDKFMNSIYEIKNLSDRNEIEKIDFKYFPEIRNAISSKQSASTKNIQIEKILDNIYRKGISRDQEILKQFKLNAKLEKAGQKFYVNYNDIVKPTDKDLLLRFLKIYRRFSGDNGETLLMNKNFFKRYRGSLGHHTSYVRQREIAHKEKLKSNDAELVAEFFEGLFKPLYFTSNGDTKSLH